MHFSEVSNELVLEIASYLDDQHLSRLAITSWRYQYLLQADLHKRAISDRSNPMTTQKRNPSPPTFSAIEWAVENGNVPLVRYLFKHNITGIEENGTGAWPLYDRMTCGDCAGDHDLVDITKLFIDKATQLGRLDTKEASRILYNILRYMESIRTRSPGCLIEYREAMEKLPRQNSANLPDRMETKTLELIEILISELGANPTGYGRRGQITKPFLHLCRDTRVLEILLRHGAHVNFHSELDIPILHCVVHSLRYDDTTIIDLLLDAGADPNILVTRETDSDIPILALTFQHEHEKRALRLLKAGAAANVRYAQGTSSTTILCEALLSSHSGSTVFIQKLLECGADPNDHWTYDGEDGLALDMALCGIWGDQTGDVVELLFQHGADPDKVDSKGRNFLQRTEQDLAEDDSWRDFDVNLRALTAAALRFRLPSLLAGEFVHAAIQSKLEVARNSGKIVLSGSTPGRRRDPSDEYFLDTAWKVFELVRDAYQQDFELDYTQKETASKLEHFWNEHRIEIQRLLGLDVE
ncbi:hypothetical protein BU16DRAFT_168264 [Lophium mytilinum]|uniref:Uncharacterized protein n=1 Tax=Lophium mytilinum TaxID=390894 RepID=A0A6A6QD75_9PEZI|nr:hypothetical protein BU16DRAFT_168264 [Lophium mytilinum]